MLSGIYGNTSGFLTDLNNTEQRITRDNQQLSSGYRVTVASDDPTAVTPLLENQNQISQLTQLVTNLNAQQTVAQTADGALQTATTLMNQLITLGTQGATSTATAANRQSLAEQVQQIQQQLVSLANTTIQGRFIFGGDSGNVQPYNYDWTTAPGALSNGTPTNTSTITGVSGSSILPGLTAGQIFDATLPNGSPDPGNVFQAAYQLGTALTANDQAGIQAALTSVQTAAAHVSNCAAVYGNTETWISQQISLATSESSNLSSQVSGLRDADYAAAATDLSQQQVALQAALAAQGSLPTKTLFSYFA